MLMHIFLKEKKIMKKKFNGLYLKERRERLGLTQLELANKVNEKHGRAIIDVTSISRWERNPEALPRNNKLVKVAETLGVPVEAFYGLEPEENIIVLQEETKNNLQLNFQSDWG